jgi:hypothetical protein
MRDRRPPPTAETGLALHRHRLRVRTVAVSFAAAVRSVHRHPDVGPSERDALIETWRAWSIDTLDEYARAAAPLLRNAANGDSKDRAALEEELKRGYRMVREA